MDLLQHPDAQALRADAPVSATDVPSWADHVEAYVARYLPCFYRQEPRQHARTLLRGKLTGLARKTTAPIATQAGQERRPLQRFVGAGGWDDRAVLGELHRPGRAELGDADAVFILDPSSFPTQGTAAWGVARQWCGRLGKVANCQGSVFLADAAPRGCALLEGRLYLSDDGAADPVRRFQTHVPEDVVFQEKWRRGLALLDRARAELPGRGVVGDDDLGRGTALRAARRPRRRLYVLDVPCHTLVRELSERRPPARPGDAARRPLCERVDQWLARQPKGRWRTVTVRDGEQGPLRVKVLLATVQTKDEDGGVGPRERLAVLRRDADQPQTWYTRSNAHDARRGDVARVQGRRQRIEELFAQGNQESGVDHYEVRSWVGWHHHLTLSLLALGFLQVERLRGGEKTPAVTPAQVRAIFTALLRPPQPGAAASAEAVSSVLRRNEASRIYHWHQATGPFPPRRPRPAPKPQGPGP